MSVFENYRNYLKSRIFIFGHPQNYPHQSQSSHTRLPNNESYRTHIHNVSASMSRTTLFFESQVSPEHTPEHISFFLRPGLRHRQNENNLIVTFRQLYTMGFHLVFKSKIPLYNFTLSPLIALGHQLGLCHIFSCPYVPSESL